MDWLICGCYFLLTSQRWNFVCKIFLKWCANSARQQDGLRVKRKVLGRKGPVSDLLNPQSSLLKHLLPPIQLPVPKIMSSKLPLRTVDRKAEGYSQNQGYSWLYNVSLSLIKFQINFSFSLVVLL